MGNRIAPDGGTRFSYALLAFALVVSLVQVVAMTPAQALEDNTGPAPVPGASTAGLQDEDGQWDTKNQHRSWFVDGRWDAILPMASTANGGVASVESAWWIVGEAIPEAPGNQPVPKLQVSATATDRPDIFWDDANSELYVLMSGGATTSLYVYSYSGGTYALLRSSTIPDFEAANSRAAIFKDSNGDLWASKMDGGGLMVSRSVDDGANWLTPVRLIWPVSEGQTQITQVGNTLAVAAAEDGDPGNESGRFSKYLFFTLDLANVANWSAVTFSTGTLTISGEVIPDETVTIGSKIYRFVSTLTGAVANDVLIGSNPRQNLADAISGAGTPGVQYQANTLPSPDVFAQVSGVNITLLANVAGTEGNVATTELMANGQFAAPTLTGGASTWARETIPLTQSSSTSVAVVHSDDELSLIKDSADNIYMVTETQRTCVNDPCGQGIGNDPQVILYTRIPAGTWTQHTVKLDQTSSVGDYKRPVVAILGNELFIMAIDNSRTGSWYWKEPLDGSLPTTTWGPVDGRVFKTDNEFFRNNIVPRDPTTTASRLPILIDWANEDPTQDNTIWQNSFPDTGNQAPQAFAGNDKVVSISPATSLGGIVTDGGDNGHDSVTADEPITALWTVVSRPTGANVVFRSSASPTSAVNPALPGAFLHVNKVGVYVLRLTATENGTDPLTNFDEVRVTVQAVNNPPTLSVSEPDNGDTVAVGQPFTFSATANDPEAGNISSSITWTSNKNGLLGTGGNLVKSNLSQGTHTITVRVSDGQNAVTVVRTLIVGSASGGGGGGGGGTPDNPFVDDNGHIFENAIEWLKAEGITLGCNPPTNDRFCPDDPVTRGEMAVFLVRALDYSDNGGGDLFVDDDGLFYENSADRLFTAQVTVGCNPPTNNRYCGERSVTRGQMAAFLARAFSLPAYNGPDRFVDDNGDIFEGAIERLAQAGITVGCNPPTNNRFCPDQAVTRGQMAAFLKRAFGE